MLLYMDDIIITGNNSIFVSSLIKLLGEDFDLKDLGLLRYFLGLQIDYTSLVCLCIRPSMHLVYLRSLV